MTATDRNAHATDEIEDAALVAMFKKGVLGVPLIFVVATLIALPGAGWPKAPLIALLPAVFAGPWLGMTIALMTRKPTPAVADTTEAGAPPALDHAA